MFPLFACDVVDIVGKFTDSVVDTGGNLPLVSVLVLLTPLVHLDLQISRRIFRKNLK
jgi:hypothetical protein